MTNKELEKRIVNLEKWCETFADFHGIDPKSVTKDICKQENPQHHDFKVGDKVKFFSEDKYHVFHDINCEITEIRDGLAHLKGDKYDVESFDFDGWTKIENLKPATDEPKCKFKVGDKVKPCDKYDSVCNPVCVGYGIVLELPINRGETYLVEFRNGNRIQIFEKFLEPYTEPRWTFTDDEKVILRNLPEKWKWIARDEGGELFVYENNPRKEKGFKYWKGNGYYLTIFGNLFQSIKWEDEVACEFRKYL